MVPGFMSRITAIAGNRRSWSQIPAGNPIVIMVAGFTPIAAGIGGQIIPGDGHRFTTGAGFIIRAAAGVGCPVMNGVPLG